MSLILKGIDMPKEDDFMALEIHKGEYRIYYTKGATIKEKRGEAIQIPNGCGRLGDLDEIGRRARASYRMGDFGINEQSLDNLHVVEDIIDNAPTILEEEEE